MLSKKIEPMQTNSAIHILISAIIAYLCFAAVQFFVWKKGGLHFTSATDATGRKANLILQICGILIFIGAGTIWQVSVNTNGQQSEMLQMPQGLPLWPIAILACATAATGIMIARKQIRMKTTSDGPSPGTWYIYFPLRTIFIILYELFFRGVLFFATMALFSVYIAIPVNIVLYYFAHILGDRKESNGSILFGLILCAIAFYYSSFWPAAIVHLALTLSYEIPFAIHSIRHIKQKI